MLASKLLFSAPWFDPEQLALSFESASSTSKAVFFAVAVLFTAIGLPRQLVAFVGGYVFGVGWGLVLSLLIALGGCALAFTLARTQFRERVLAKYPTAVSTLDAITRDDAFVKIIVLRLQPLGTNLLTNICAGVSSINAALFLLASAIGYVPQMLVFALTGSGLRVNSQHQLIISGVLLLLSLALGWWLLQRHRQRNSGHT